MNRCFILVINLLIFALNSAGQSGPVIDTYPPQIHQQICQESTFTRYLNVLNLGDETLVFTGAFSPGPVGWATAAPLSGVIEPGDTSIIEFNFNSSGLPIDNYLVDFILSSNDPVTPELTVLCMLHVQDLHIILEAEDDTVCSGCSTTLNAIVFGCSEAYSFNWTSIPPGFTSTLKSPVVSPLVTSTYIVTVTDGGYSKQDSIEIAVEGPIGITENRPGFGINVYPNPGNGVFNVKFNADGAGQGMINVIDLSARLVLSEEFFINEGENDLLLRATHLEPGIYLILIKADELHGIIGISKVFLH
jgi:hypothetical protein